MDRLSLTLPAGRGDTALHHGQRRAHERWPVQADVELLEPAVASGITINASVGGMRIAVDCALRAGDVCLLRVRFPSGKETLERGQIVWSREARDGCIAGLQFLGRN
ncbi:MAG: PilZ domain-containing protein [Polyangiaceae bacterium]|nr:PilZ domain-containing protein [Polyangiaceae bacterium]